MAEAASPPPALERRLNAAATACEREGETLTPLRRAVLALVLQARRPLTAYQLLEQLRTARRAAPPTIYRALDFLLARRLVHRIERLGAFVACAEPEHEHALVQFLICRQCDAVVELDDHDVGEAVAAAARSAGFRLEHAVIEVDGLCAACAAGSCRG
ncbi:MAG: transcriptional repressor [Rhodospirillales bacterium]|nr:transcriptional repressor [Rhodospirillales bacterium]